ncbi:hypothetical protein EJB05_08924, partial [Eragrostis curvula]
MESLRDCGTYGYIVCNPATEQWVAVPSSEWTVSPPVKKQWDYQEEITRDAHHFLIFDPAISSHFHLVQVGHHRVPKVVEAVVIYSSETGVWTNNTQAWMQFGERWTSAVDVVKSKLGSAYLNGRLHLIIYSCYYLQTVKGQIVAVDMRMQPCKIIRWPETKEFSVPAFIGQSQGLLHCISGHRKIEEGPDYITGLSIWVLEDYDAEQWVLKLSVSCSQLFGEMSCRIDELDVVAIHPDHSLVFIVHSYNQKLISYDMDTMEVCSHQALGHGCRSVVPYVPYFVKLPTLVPRHTQDRATDELVGSWLATVQRPEEEDGIGTELVRETVRRCRSRATKTEGACYGSVGSGLGRCRRRRARKEER